MEVLAKTEYQDVYRVTDGVLLIVNKFTYIDYSKKTTRFVRLYKTDRKNSKSYAAGCQKWLKILTKDYLDEYCSLTVPAGTVLYYDRPIISTDNKNDWDIQIKTTGEAFSGNYDEIQNMLSSILDKIRTDY